LAAIFAVAFLSADGFAHACRHFHLPFQAGQNHQERTEQGRGIPPWNKNRIKGAHQYRVLAVCARDDRRAGVKTADDAG